VKVGFGHFDLSNCAVWAGEHAPLKLGWRDDQLVPVIELLSPLLPGGLTANMLHAAAAIVRSLVVDYQLTGQPVRYSRNRNHYGSAPRYRRGDPRYSWYFVTNSMDLLAQASLIGHALGEWLCSERGGKQSVAWPTPELLALTESVIDLGDRRGELGSEVIILRDRQDKKDIDYEDTDETHAMRAEIEALNEALGQLDLYRQGKSFPIPLMRRVFNGTLERGGRCYCCHGKSFQNIRAKERLDLLIAIHGVLHPVVEIDYANLHAVMAYTQAGLSTPPGDQYVIDGIDRGVVKRAFNILLNAGSRGDAVSALVEDLHRKDDELWLHSGLPTQYRRECHPFAEKVVSAIEKKHHRIAGYFGSDSGAAFMRRDSDMAVRVMTLVLAETGRCPLPIHDSFLVADLDQEVLASVMHQIASEEGLPLCLKVSSSFTPVGPVRPSPSLLGRNNP
jgi:hypothetical protein